MNARYVFARDNRFIAIAFSIGILFASANPLAAQTDDQQADEQLPEAQKIIADFISALGGADALKDAPIIKIDGTMELPQGQEATFVTYYGPDRFYRKMDLPGGVVYEQGYNGETAWERNPSLGDRRLEGDEKEDFIRRMNHLDMLTWTADFDGEIETKSQGISVRGVDCYEVVFAPKSGNKVSRLFAEDTGLLIKVATILESPNGPLAVDIFHDDYKPFGNAKMSMKRTQEISGTQISFTYKEVAALEEFPEQFEAVPFELN